jgi:hypothetical protein
VVADNRNEIREFLTSRRARIPPEQSGLPAYGGNRRVAGLRREEVALLARVSIDYYTRLEWGVATGSPIRPRPGDAPGHPGASPPGHAAAVRPSAQRVLDAMTGAPAYMRNGCADIAVPGGRDRYDRGLSDLVGELSTRSEEFGTRWAARNVRRHRTGRKQLPWAVAGVQRRARVSLPGRPGPAGLLGGHARPARPGGDGPGARPGVTGGP